MNRFANLFVIPFVGVVAFAGNAAADPSKAQCIDANKAAQDLVHEHKLLGARDLLRACSNAACPAAVRNDCTERLDAVERELPTIVLDVKDGDGNDLTDVHVTVDGAAWVDSIDGSPREIDPGTHELSFQVAGQAPVTKKILVHDGDKALHEAAVIGAPTKPAEHAVIAAKPSAEVVVPRVFNAQKALGATLTVVGVLGFAVGGFLGLSASSQWSSAQCALPISCGNVEAQQKHDDAVGNATASTIFFISGGILAAGGVVLFVTAPRAEAAATPSARISISPSAAPGGGGVSMKGTF
ncbi:MAG: hypothetical protein ABI183_02355 [Polyangiaceae bacterium]